MRLQAIGMAVLLASCSNQAEDAVNKDGMIILARQAIEGKLRDPDSARFRNEKLGSYQGNPVVCGEVNAKNGFGGMTGFSRFISNGGDATVTESDMEPAEFSKVWDTMGC